MHVRDMQIERAVLFQCRDDRTNIANAAVSQWYHKYITFMILIVFKRCLQLRQLQNEIFNNLKAKFSEEILL